MRYTFRLVRGARGMVLSFARRLRPGRKYHPKDKRKTAVLVALFIFLSYYIYTILVRFLLMNKNSNKKCIIPDIDPFDTSIMKYVRSPNPLFCDPMPDLLFVDDSGFLQYDQSAVRLFGSKSYRCKYAIIDRKYQDDYNIDFSAEVEFSPPVQVPSDFFRVSCWDKKHKKVYSGLHESVFKKTIVERKFIADEKDPKYSVLIFGLDSTSRLTAIRNLPKTYDFLTNELDAFVFKGYMKIGDDTFPNVISILTGKRPWTEDIPLPATKYQSYYIDDIFHFLWQNYSRENYATFYAEDYPEIAKFNTETAGFKNSPTDHYMRPWMLASQKFEYNYINPKKTSPMCFGNKPVHRHVINYYKRFVKAYRNKLKFGFSFLTHITHESMNHLEHGDNDFCNFLKFLKEGGHLKNSFLVFMSDQGPRMGAMRNTVVGRIEERMPIISIVPPESFRKKYTAQMKNLRENTEALTSNLDLHETLNDILLSNFETSLSFETLTRKRGISFFREIPKERICADVSIPEHYCACYETTRVEFTDQAAIICNAAKFAVSFLNNLLKSYQDVCADLKLHKLHEAYAVSLGSSSRSEEENRGSLYKFFSNPEVENHKRFIVLFETIPGHAMFESTVSYNIYSGVKVLDDVSRTNEYGNTSRCVPVEQLRKYCYCKSNLR